MVAQPDSLANRVRSQTDVRPPVLAIAYLVACFWERYWGESPLNAMNVLAPVLLLMLAQSIGRTRLPLYLAGIGLLIRLISPEGVLSAAVATARDLMVCLANNWFLWRFGKGPAANWRLLGDDLASQCRMLRGLVEQQERERKLISSELHDGILQHIIVAHMLAQVIEQGVDSSNSELTANLNSLRSALTQAMQEGRRLIHDLCPPLVDETGIVGAISHFVKDESDRGKTRCRFESRGDFDDLPPMLEGNIVRIVQEALNNARKHSQAKSIDVTMQRSNQTIRLRIQDDGIGFDPRKVSCESFGLTSIRQRAKLFGGCARVRSKPGKGTSIDVELPVQDSSTGLGNNVNKP
jgi:signal transduction histidine kinase